jgi:hypothetical protein
MRLGAFGKAELGREPAFPSHVGKEMLGLISYLQPATTAGSNQESKSRSTSSPSRSFQNPLAPFFSGSGSRWSDSFVIADIMADSLSLR